MLQVDSGKLAIARDLDSRRVCAVQYPNTLPSFFSLCARVAVDAQGTQNTVKCRLCDKPTQRGEVGRRRCAVREGDCTERVAGVRVCTRQRGATTAQARRWARGGETRGEHR